MADAEKAVTLNDPIASLPVVMSPAQFAMLQIEAGKYPQGLSLSQYVRLVPLYSLPKQ